MNNLTRASNELSVARCSQSMSSFIHNLVITLIMLKIKDSIDEPDHSDIII